MLPSRNRTLWKGRIARKFRGTVGQYLVAIQLQDHVAWAKVTSRLGSRLQEQVWFGCPPKAVTVFDDSENALGVALKRS